MVHEVASQSFLFYGPKPDREEGLNLVLRIHALLTVRLLPFYRQNLISEIVKRLVI